MHGVDPVSDTACAAQRKRLRWRCRRGMRELDVLLEPWFDEHAAAMSATELALFERFLDSSDMDLYAWMTGRGRPADQGFAGLVDRILAR
ncbi:MAG: succinate dehydrogenase assembly factor 2 [Gammaproteobacteria bacterium]